MTIRTRFTFLGFMALTGCISIPWAETDRPNCVADVFFPIRDERVTWTGECLNGKANGQGKLISSSGTQLEGIFRGGIVYDAEGRVAAPRPDGQKVFIGATFKAGRGEFYHLRKDAAGFQTYAHRLAQTFRREIIFTEKPVPAPVAVVELEAEPNGKIKFARLRQGSGNPFWDAAVLKAVSKVPYLPSDADGIVPPRIVIDFRPY